MHIAKLLPEHRIKRDKAQLNLPWACHNGKKHAYVLRQHLPYPQKSRKVLDENAHSATEEPP